MKKPTSCKKYNIVVYVENCSPKVRKFSTLKSMNDFLKKFNKKFPDSNATISGNWIDFSVTGITGNILPNENLDFDIQ